jgi:hypothetical protein
MSANGFKQIEKVGLMMGGVKKSGSGGGIGMPPMLRRFAASRAPAVRGKEKVAVVPEIKYRYFKMYITGKRVNSDAYYQECQMAEFAFYSQDETNINLNSLNITNPGGSNTTNETIDKLIDGNINTKWNDTNYYNNTQSVIIIDFGAEYITKPIPKFYRWITGNDFLERDPVTWTISGSIDNTTWYILDQQSNYDTTTSRKSFVPSTGYFTLNYS